MISETIKAKASQRLRRRLSCHLRVSLSPLRNTIVPPLQLLLDVSVDVSYPFLSPLNLFSHRSAEPKRGDIVVFESSEFGEDLIKRVVGLPGDNILIVHGSLYVNGEQQKEPYLNTELSDKSSYGPDTVPPGHVFVMGDNRADSSDSRIFGPVPEESILGKAFLRLWPPSRIGSIET